MTKLIEDTEAIPKQRYQCLSKEQNSGFSEKTRLKHFTQDTLQYQTPGVHKLFPHKQKKHQLCTFFQYCMD